MEDIVNCIMCYACRLFGGKNDGIFNAACFSSALEKMTCVKRIMDGSSVRAILHGRPDVRQLSDGSHFQII